MAIRVEPKDVVQRLAQMPRPPLIAIDGLPCSGKSTLARAIRATYGFECLYLDDFVRPEKDWPSLTKPAFPFEFVRYDEFIASIQRLASTGECTYAPFDWDELAISHAQRTITLDRAVIIEGVSALNPDLCDLYGCKIFVDSDRTTTLRAARERGPNLWVDEWRDLFLPSADIYMQTQPERRADLIVRGRGAS